MGEIPAVSDQPHGPDWCGVGDGRSDIRDKKHQMRVVPTNYCYFGWRQVEDKSHPGGFFGSSGSSHG